MPTIITFLACFALASTTETIPLSTIALAVDKFATVDERRAALDQIAQCQPADSLILPLLGSVLSDRDRELRMTAAAILAKYPQARATDYLAWALSAQPNEEEFIFLSESLGKQQTRLAFEELLLRYKIWEKDTRARQIIKSTILLHYPNWASEITQANLGKDSGRAAVIVGSSIFGGTLLGAFGSINNDRRSVAIPVGVISGLGSGTLVSYFASKDLEMSTVQAHRLLSYEFAGAAWGYFLPAAIYAESRGDYPYRGEAIGFLGATGALLGLAGGFADRGQYDPYRQAFVDTGLVAGSLTGLGLGLAISNTRRQAGASNNLAAIAGSGFACSLAGGAVSRWLAPSLNYDDQDLAALTTFPVLGALLTPAFFRVANQDLRTGIHAGVALSGGGLGYFGALLVSHYGDNLADPIMTSEIFGVYGVATVLGASGLIFDHISRSGLAAVGLLGFSTGAALGGSLYKKINLQSQDGALLGLATGFTTWQAAAWNAEFDTHNNNTAPMAYLGIGLGGAVGLTLAHYADISGLQVAASSSAVGLGGLAGILGGAIAETGLNMPSLLGADAGLVGSALLLGLTDIDPRVIAWLAPGGIAVGGLFSLIAFAATDSGKAIQGAALAGLGTGSLAAGTWSALAYSKQPTPQRAELWPNSGSKLSRLRLQGIAPQTMSMLEGRPLLGARIDVTIE